MGRTPEDPTRRHAGCVQGFGYLVRERGTQSLPGTLIPALLHSASAAHSDWRQQVAQVLYSVALKLHNPRLSTLAYRAKLDVFTRVKKAIVDMIAQLL